MAHYRFARAFSLAVLFTTFLWCGCSQLQISPATPNEPQAASPDSGAFEAEGPDNTITNLGHELTGDEDAAATGGAAGSETESVGLTQAEEVGKKTQPYLDEALTFCELSQDQWQKGELDQALESLDHAYALILKIEAHDDPKLIRQKEDLRFLISKRILEIYASRNIVINGQHKEIPIVINKYVQAEIDRFTRGSERDFFIRSYQRSGRYRPLMVSALREVGLPEALSWLPLIESGFKTNALSPARALGLWQFIPSTGYKFGLKRDSYIDQRLDPYHSTAAAIAYLNELHQMFGDWTTVLAAYNCGEGRVLKVIRQQNVNYLDNFWDLFERLPWETARYVPRFLATLHIVNNLETYGMDSIIVDPPMSFDEVEVKKQVHLKHVAQSLGVEMDQLTALNPELRYKILPPDTYILRIPKGTAENLMAGLDQMPVTRLPSKTYVYHRVRRGETLSVIARKYRTSVGKIMRANNLHSSHFIRTGYRLKIPKPGYQFRSSARYSQPVKSQTYMHKVSRGDSLWNIAKRYGTTTQKISELNGLDTSHLYIGQTLKLPGHPSTAAATASYKIYEVKPGDSPFTIARQHNMPLSRFLQINRLSARSRIYPGQQLLIE